MAAYSSCEGDLHCESLLSHDIFTMHSLPEFNPTGTYVTKYCLQTRILDYSTICPAPAIFLPEIAEKSSALTVSTYLNNAVNFENFKALQWFKFDISSSNYQIIKSSDVNSGVPWSR